MGQNQLYMDGRLLGQTSSTVSNYFRAVIPTSVTLESYGEINMHGTYSCSFQLVVPVRPSLFITMAVTVDHSTASS